MARSPSSFLEPTKRSDTNWFCIDFTKLPRYSREKVAAYSRVCSEHAKASSSQLLVSRVPSDSLTTLDSNFLLKPALSPTPRYTVAARVMPASDE